MREILSVPPVGHGNPATALALLELAEANPDLDPRYLVLSATAWAARRFHEHMTQDPAEARKYIDNPEKRTSLKSRAYAAASAAELALRAGRAKNGMETAWNVVQEHPMLGSNPRVLRSLGINTIRLTTPDVGPKESGIEAARKHGASATIYVWNRQAQEALQREGLRTALTAPYLHNFRQGEEGHTGRRIVAKTSGSGFPPEWRKGLLGALCAVDGDWAFHAPDMRYTNDGASAKKAGNASIRQYYEDVGPSTELLVCYPSELVGLAAGRNEAGHPTSMITFPARGAHERDNLQFAVSTGLVLGELALGNEGPSIDDPRLRQIRLAELPGFINSIDSVQPGWERGQGLVGDVPFWDVALQMA